MWGAGDCDEAFSIQSISKVFMLALALEKVGPALWEKVGREPSGSAFNSIVQLETEHGKPRNPLINPGAMVVTDTLIGDRGADAAIEALLAFLRAQARDAGVAVDEEVAESESETGARNRSLAWFMKNFGVLSQRGRDGARRLFPAMRGGDELPAAGARGPVPRLRRPRSGDRASRSSPGIARGGSTA